MVVSVGPQQFQYVAWLAHRSARLQVCQWVNETSTWLSSDGLPLCRWFTGSCHRLDAGIVGWVVLGKNCRRADENVDLLGSMSLACPFNLLDEVTYLAKRLFPLRASEYQCASVAEASEYLPGGYSTISL